MGIMPPYNPFDDHSLAWAIARVLSCEPRTATWASPAVVRFAIETVLRGTLPNTVTALFNAPREAGQSYFYVARGLGVNPTPEQHAAAAAQSASLDATQIELPAVGARVIGWFGEYLPPQLTSNDGPPMPPGMQPMNTPVTMPSEGVWQIPTLRLFDQTGLPMHSRWIDHNASSEREVRRRLGV